MTDEHPLSPAQGEPDRFPLWAVYVALAVLGLVLGVWEAFLVPLRLPGGVEGLSVVLALAGNLGLGVLAARAIGAVPASVMPGIGWLVALLLTNGLVRPSDEVIIPGRLGSDPGVVTVGWLFMLGGVAGAVLATVVANRQHRES